MDEIRFYNGEMFVEDDVFIFNLDRGGNWFDFCPCDGISDFNSDKNCLLHIKIVDNIDHFIVCLVPNFKHESYELNPNHSESYLVISKIVKKDIWKLVNEFNKGNCIFKIADVKLDEECLFLLGGETLLNKVVKDYKECSEFLTLFNIKDFVF